MLGCLRAFLQTTINKRFSNHKRIKQKGLHTEIDFGFDKSKILSREQIAQRKQAHPELGADVSFTGTISACGAPNDLPQYQPTVVEEPHNDIQVFLIEDEESTRVALRQALRSQPGIDVYSEATNADTGLVLLTSVTGGDVALVDLSLPDKTGVEVAQQFRQVRETSDNPNLKLCLLLSSDRPEEILTALAAGVPSYCLKTAPIERLAEAIRRTHAGYFYLDGAIALQLLGLVRERESEAILTQPELEVLASLAAGSTEEAIAQNLGTNVDTVKTHIANILDRLYISDWVQRTVKA